MNTKEKIEQMNKSFAVSSVCRLDLLQQGFTKKQIAKITDEDMERIACKMGDAYCENGFWDDLQIMTDRILEDK